MCTATNTKLWLVLVQIKIYLCQRSMWHLSRKFCEMFRKIKLGAIYLFLTSTNKILAFFFSSLRNI